MMKQELGIKKEKAEWKEGLKLVAMKPTAGVCPLIQRQVSSLYLRVSLSVKRKKKKLLKFHLRYNAQCIQHIVHVGYIKC